MAKQAGVGSTVYKVVEVIGTSTQSWEDAAKNRSGDRRAHAAGSARGRGCKDGHDCQGRQSAGIPHASVAVFQI